MFSLIWIYPILVHGQFYCYHLWEYHMKNNSKQNTCIQLKLVYYIHKWRQWNKWFNSKYLGDVKKMLCLPVLFYVYIKQTTNFPSLNRKFILTFQIWWICTIYFPLFANPWYVLETAHLTPKNKVTLESSQRVTTPIM